ncbi:unnamed protein product, partial [Nesidiocoris tenuis]
MLMWCLECMVVACQHGPPSVSDLGGLSETRRLKVISGPGKVQSSPIATSDIALLFFEASETKHSIPHRILGSWRERRNELCFLRQLEEDGSEQLCEVLLIFLEAVERTLLLDYFLDTQVGCQLKDAPAKGVLSRAPSWLEKSLYLSAQLPDKPKEHK